MSHLNRKMSDAHEEFLAYVFGGRRTRGSGNQWNDQADGRMNRREAPVAWGWDGKSTRAASITITRNTLDKIVEQAGAERPMLAVRFYDDDRLRGFEDWAMVKVDDLVELLQTIDVLQATIRGEM